MKRQMKKVIAMLCAVALFVTGLNFVPQAVNAADEGWFDATFDLDDEGSWKHHKTDVTTAGAEDGIWDYVGCPGFTAQYTNGDSLEGFSWKFSGSRPYYNVSTWLETDDLSQMAIATENEQKVKPTIGATYKLSMKMEFDANVNGTHDVQLWMEHGDDENKDIEQHIKFNKKSAETKVFELKDYEVVFMPGNEYKLHMGFGVNENYKQEGTNTNMRIPSTLAITEFKLERADVSEVVTPNDDTFKPSEDNPWTMSAHYVQDPDAGSYGWMNYGVKEGSDEKDYANTQMRLVSTVGEPEKDKDGNRITDPGKRWWWISGSLMDIASQVGLTDKFYTYTGSMNFYTSKATGEDCYLYVYIGGNEFQFALDEGWNTLNFDEFTYKAGESIKFLFDEMPKGAIVSVSDIGFIKGAGDGWSTVPNADPTFTKGPWNMFGNFDEINEGNYGVLQYKENKENPETYSDYSFRVGSASGWEAWSVFARLENYLADYLDEGDEFSLTIKLNSSKATVPVDKTEKPNALDQLLVVVGSEKYYFDLQAGDNTLEIKNATYKLGTGLNRHEQIMFEMDGLQEGTELTVTDIDLTGPNDDWTNVPNKKDTVVGDWTLFGWSDETHYSKLAYRDNGTDSGMGSTDIKVRRTSGAFGAMAATAKLKDYLATAKDTKNRSLSHGDEYQAKVTIKTSSLDDSIGSYGKMRATINGTAFDFNLKSGTNTYDLLELCGKKFTYDSTQSKDIEFELDEVTAKSFLTISKVEFIGPDDESEEVPNGEAFKPEGTPWTLYAITDAKVDKYGAMRYEVKGDPAVLSSLKMTLKSVSGWFDARSIRATLNGKLDGLEAGKTYRLRVKINIDESKVIPSDKTVSYDKKLRIIANDQNFDFNVPDNASGTYTYETDFTLDALKNKHVAFNFDQMLKGTVVYFEDVEVFDPSATTEAPTTTEEPTSETPTVTETPSVEPSTEAPTGETATQTPSSATQNPSDVTTKGADKVKAPGKAKIKKVYKKKLSAKKLKVKLKKVKGAKGYQIAVYKSKKKAKKNKKALVKKYTKKLKVTIKSKKLKRKKKLYVRARAYVLNVEGLKVFGKWGNIKKVKRK